MVSAMRKVLQILSILVLLGGIAAAEKETREEVSSADATRLEEFFKKFVDTVIANKDSCPKMATEVSKVIDANIETVKMANAAKKANKKLPKATEEKMMAKVKEMMPAMQKCGSDKDVKAAIAKMDIKDDKPPQKAEK